MPFRFARSGHVLSSLLIAVLLAAALVVAGQAQTPAGAVAAFDPAKATLDRIERAIQHEGLGEEAYADLKRQLMPLRDELRDKIEALEPQLAEAATRLNQLGDKPAPGAAAEDAAITAERASLTASRAEIEAALKQARLLALRADQISDRINERRRALFARELFARTAGVLDPAFWRTTLDAAADEARSIADLVSGWWDYVRSNGGHAGIAGAVGDAACACLRGGDAAAMVVAALRRHDGRHAVRPRASPH